MMLVVPAGIEVSVDAAATGLNVISDPVAVEWNGGGGIKALYCCPYCGHVWTCYWSASVFFGA
jgi:hypothetical protein